MYWRNSRRLKDAAKRVDEEIAWFHQKARTLTVAECEGGAELHAAVVAVMRIVANVLEYRHRYLKIVPWSFSNADSQVGAQAFLAGVRSRPSNQHDPLTVYLYDLHKEDLERMSEGCDDELPELVEAVDQFNDSPLDESAGEGYHRSTHHARMRAYNARSPYLKQSVRCKDNLWLLRKFLGKGPRGARVIRYEWRFWSRVLQVKPRQQWWRKKMAARDVFHRVYRMDSLNETNWNVLCDPVKAPGQGPPPPEAPSPGSTKDTDSLRIDYLTSVLQVRQYYCFDRRMAGLDDGGLPTETVERQYFQILSVVTSQSKPKQIPTIESHQETMVKSRLALSVQSFTEKPKAHDAAGGIVLFEDSDPQWLSWSELGPWQEVRGTLQRFERVIGSVDYAGCVLAYDPVVAKPPYSLTDFKCPAIMMIAELHRLGWRATKARVLHETPDIGAMDSREATKMKAYYITLLEITRCFPFAKLGLPSDQPILYYKLLLKGVSVDFGLGNQAYLAIMRGLEQEPPGPGIDESSDEEIIYLSVFNCQ